MVQAEVGESDILKSYSFASCTCSAGYGKWFFSTDHVRCTRCNRWWITVYELRCTTNNSLRLLFWTTPQLANIIKHLYGGAMTTENCCRPVNGGGREESRKRGRAFWRRTKTSPTRCGCFEPKTSPLENIPGNEKSSKITRERREKTALPAEVDVQHETNMRLNTGHKRQLYCPHTEPVGKTSNDRVRWVGRRETPPH